MARKNRGTFKIDDAKPPVRLAIGNVAHLGVQMVHTIGLQFRKNFSGALLIQMFDPDTAIRRDNPELFGIRFQQPGYEVAISLLEMTKDSDFVGETLLGIRATKSLVDPAIVTDPDRGS